MHPRLLPNSTPSIPLSQVHGLPDKSLFEPLVELRLDTLCYVFLVSVSLLDQAFFLFLIDFTKKSSIQLL